MIQDAPVSGTPLPAAFLARMAHEIEHVSYFKIETAGAANKLRELIALGGDAFEGPWDGEEATTLLADLDAGATGAMTGGVIDCDAPRHPFPTMQPATRAELLDAAKRLDPLVLRWAL